MIFTGQSEITKIKPFTNDHTVRRTIERPRSRKYRWAAHLRSWVIYGYGATTVHIGAPIDTGQRVWLLRGRSIDRGARLGII